MKRMWLAWAVFWIGMLGHDVVSHHEGKGAEVPFWVGVLAWFVASVGVVLAARAGYHEGHEAEAELHRRAAP